MPDISLVVPCFNEEQSLPLFYSEIDKIRKLMSNFTFELIFVDDGSKDNTASIIKNLRAKDETVRYNIFSRNFGKEGAIYAGIKMAKGDYVAIMDADLQDPPSLLSQMMEAIQNEGVDCVATRRATRKGEPPIRSFFARAFYKLINKISKIEIVDGARDFRLMTRQMVSAILEMSEYNRFSKGIFSWVGFETRWLAFENIERVAGETKWSFWKLFMYSIEGIVAFTTVPLAIASIAGLFFCLLAFVAIVVVSIREMIWHGSAYGWASLICVIFLVGGIQLFCTGILGQYMAKTYLETKKRPIYISKEEG